MNDPDTVDVAVGLGAMVVRGEMDPITACHKMLVLKPLLPDVPAELWDVFSAVASETDALPIGGERRFWNPDVLEAKDRELADYRRRVRHTVTEAFEKLLTLLKQ